MSLAGSGLSDSYPELRSSWFDAYLEHRFFLRSNERRDRTPIQIESEDSFEVQTSL